MEQGQGKSRIDFLLLVKTLTIQSRVKRSLHTLVVRLAMLGKPQS